MESSEAAVRSIELQLVRVETCGEGPGPPSARSLGGGSEGRRTGREGGDSGTLASGEWGVCPRRFSWSQDVLMAEGGSLDGPAF